MMPHDDLDQLLATAMPGRPAPPPITNLAARAIAQAQQTEARIRTQHARLARLRSLTCWINLAACILIAILTVGIFYRAETLPNPPAPNELALTTQPPTDAPDAADSALSQLDVELLCAAILLGAAVAVAIEQSLRASTGLQIQRFAPARA